MSSKFGSCSTSYLHPTHYNILFVFNIIAGFEGKTTTLLNVVAEASWEGEGAGLVFRLLLQRWHIQQTYSR